MAKDKFLHGAMILTLAGLVVKIIGSVNRILLSRLLGGEGIGLYQMAYPVYFALVSHFFGRNTSSHFHCCFALFGKG